VVNAGGGYTHTQTGRLRIVLLIAAGIFLAIGYFAPPEAARRPVFAAVAVVCIFLSFAFEHLTIRDEGDRLGVRFGPLPLFKKTIPYAEMTGVKRSCSTFLAGWGIHWTRRGWLWNIGGLDCVRIEMGSRSVLLGTNDPDGLIAFLLSRIGPGRGAGEAGA